MFTVGIEMILSKCQSNTSYEAAFSMFRSWKSFVLIFGKDSSKPAFRYLSLSGSYTAPVLSHYFLPTAGWAVTVTYSYTDAHNCTASTTWANTVHAPQPVNVNWFDSICANGTRILEADRPDVEFTVNYNNLTVTNISGTGQASVKGNTVNTNNTTNSVCLTINNDYCTPPICHDIKVVARPAPATIYIKPPGASITNSLTLCIDDPAVTLLASEPGGTWSTVRPVGADVDPNSGDVRVFDLGSQTVAYTYQGPDYCPVLDVTFALNVVDCNKAVACVPDHRPTIVNYDLDQNAQNDFPTGLYYIGNDITVSGHASFTDADIVVAKDVKIKIVNEGFLDIRGSRFHTCGDEMWNGFVVEEGGYLSLAGTPAPGRSSLIEDAKTAIDMRYPKFHGFQPGSLGDFLHVENTIFNKNWLSVKIKDFNDGRSSGNARLPFTIKNTVFTSRDIRFDYLSWPNVAALKGINVLRGLASDPTRVPPGVASPYISDADYPDNTPGAFLKSPCLGLKPYGAVRLENMGWSNDDCSDLGKFWLGSADVEPETTCPDISENYNTNVIDNMYFYGVLNLWSNLKVVNTVFQKPARTEDAYAMYLNMENVPNDYKEPYAFFEVFHGYGICSRAYRLNGQMPSNRSIPYTILDVSDADGSLPKNAFFDHFVAVSDDGSSWYDISGNEIRSREGARYNFGFQNTTVRSVGIEVYPDNHVFNLLANRNGIKNIHYPITVNCDRQFDAFPFKVNENRIGLCGPDENGCPLDQQVNVAVRLMSNGLPGIYQTEPLECNANTIVGAESGIYLNNWKRRAFTVLNNEIRPIKEYGILVANSGVFNKTGREQWSSVSGNKILPYGEQFVDGIRMESAAVTDFGCNYVAGARNEIRCKGFNDAVTIKDNDLSGTQATNGLVLDGDDCYIGNQGYDVCTSGNRWIDNWSGEDQYKTYCIDADATNSPLFVKSGNALFSPLDQSGGSTNSQFTFYQGPNGNGSVIFIDDDKCNHCWSGGLRTRPTVGNGFGTGTTVAATAKAWKATGQKPAVNKLQFRNPAALSYSDKVALGLLPLLGQDSSNKLYVLQQQLFASLVDAPWQSLSPVLQNFVILNAFGNLGSLYAADTLLAAGDTAGAASALSSVSPNNQVEVNGLNYYGWLSRLKNGSGLNPGDTLEIYALAESCPSIHGAVVFAARSLYDKVTGNHRGFSDNCPTAPVTSRLKKVQEVPSKSIVSNVEMSFEKTPSAYPNPSNGLVNFRFPELGRWHVDLIDQSGKTVWSKSFFGISGKENFKETKGAYRIKYYNESNNRSMTQTIILQ